MTWLRVSDEATNETGGGMSFQPDHRSTDASASNEADWLTAFAEAGAWRRLSDGGDLGSVSTAWLDLLVAQIEHVLAAEAAPVSGTHPSPVVRTVFVALGEPGSERYLRAASRGREASADLIQAAERCLKQRRSVIQTPRGDRDGTCHLAYPVLADDALAGVVAVELTGAARARVEAVLRLLQWGSPWLVDFLRRRAHSPANSETPADRSTSGVVFALQALADDAPASALAEAFASRIADTLSLDRVAIGRRRRGQTRLLAGSHGGFSAVHNDFAAALVAAMDEAADIGSQISWPAEDPAAISHPAHARLCRVHDRDYALSLPLRASDETGEILVVTILARAAPDAEALETLRKAASIAAPSLRAALKAERGLFRHAAASARDGLRQLAPSRFGFKGALALAVPVIAGVMFVPIDYSVSASAGLEGVSRRAIVAPFDGFVASVMVRPGERVEESTLLGRMDDRELRLQEIDLKARLGETQRQLDQAMGQRDHAAINILSARRAQNLAQLDLIASNLQRAELRAPFQSFVVSGGTDLIGAPLRRGDPLFEVSPLDAYRVTIDVPQGEFAAVRVGQTGHILLTALPNRSFPFRIERLTPIATAKDGESVVRVEAALDSPEPMLRPGMQGIARIDVGERRIGWILGHRLWTAALLKLWAWLP